MFSKLENILIPLAVKLGQNKILIAIRAGLGRLVHAGFRCCLQCCGPLFLSRYSLCLCIQAAAVAVIAFLILTPNRIPIEGVKEPVSGLSFDQLGTNGIFVGLIVALTSVEIYAYVIKKGWTIKMPDGVPPAVSKSFVALIPSALVMLLFFVINILFGLTPYGTVHDFIFNVLQIPLRGAGNTLAAQIVYDLACTIFWFFGINGPAVANSVFAPISKILTMETLMPFKPAKPCQIFLLTPFQTFSPIDGGF